MNTTKNNRPLAVALGAVAAALLMGACQQKKSAPETQGDLLEQPAVNDTTVYGRCGAATAMHTLELVTDKGDTLVYSIDSEEDEQENSCVKGGLFSGDRLAVVGHKDAQGMLVADGVVNLTSLLGRWGSIDKCFDILEGGVVEWPNARQEAAPFLEWSICNGQLVLSRDTFEIYQLGADSLYLENREGIFGYKRITAQQ